MNVLAVIPARLESSRLPGKALVDIGGLPMIYRVYQQVKKASRISRVIVATDNNEIIDAVHSRGGEAVLTSPNHQSGTDRIIEVCQDIKENYVLNVQGDEPFIEPELLDNLILFFEKKENQIFDVVTPVCPFKQDEIEEINNPDIVKVVISVNSKALYFSRFPIPFHRNKNHAYGNDLKYYRHLGVYLFKKDYILNFNKLKNRYLEEMESLEQLRVLENDGQIGVYIANSAPFDVNTPEDLEKARQFVKEMNL